MNRDAMIEALAKAIQLHPLPAHGGVHMGGGQARSVAAALLDLCGPEPLFWVGKEEDCFLNCDLGHRNYDLHVSDTLERTCDYIWSASYQESGMGRPLHLGRGNLEEAKNAAQDHATAAHWANTPLGKLVQP